jgi:hypothetical protein
MERVANHHLQSHLPSTEKGNIAMKITDPQIIQTGEKKLIAAMQKHLDLETVKKILSERMAETSFESKGGQIVVHDNQIAFRLDFDLQLTGSLLFDRQGNYIPDSPETPILFSKDTSDNDKTSPSYSDHNTMENWHEDDNDADLDLLLDEEASEPRNESVENAPLSDHTDDALDPDDILDDDIDDILKESREFWDQKKDS